MLAKIIEFGAKVFGLGWIWEKIDGYKRYIGGLTTILTGLSGMLLAAAAELNNFVANVHGLGDLFKFLEALVKTPDAPALAFIAAWAAVLKGWDIIAQAHAEDKKHDELINAHAETAAAVDALPAIPNDAQDAAAPAGAAPSPVTPQGPPAAV